MAAIIGITVVAPKEAHRYTMIFLHGRDDDPAQFPESVLESETSAPKRELPDVFPSMKWVFPASKKRESLRFKDNIVQVGSSSATTPPLISLAKSCVVVRHMVS
jgi:lysophospholipase II